MKATSYLVAFFIFALMFYIYFIYSASSDIYYVGHSDNYSCRLEQHNNSDRDTFSKKHRPWELKAAFEVGNDRGTAIKIERFIKKQKSRKLIEPISDRLPFYHFVIILRVPQ